MKKKLFFFAAAAVALASCSSDDTIAENSKVTNNQPQEIAIFPLAQPNTRAAVTTAVFPESYNFLISAYAVDAAKDYFGKTEYANEATTTIWSGVAGQKRYWPLSPETLNFLAVTKSDADGTNTTFGTAGANFASKETVVLADNKSTQHDLMYSYARAAVTKVGNTLTFNGGANVAMTFYHAQSYVCFTVKAANEATRDAGIVVTGIKLNDAVYNGTATVNLANYNSKTSDLAATLAWDGTAYTSATPYDVDVPGTTHAFPVTVDSNTSAITAGDGLMIVPNPTKTAEVLNASIGTFIVYYKMPGIDNVYEFEYTPTAAQKQMLPGYKYTFNIVFSLTEIKVEPVVQPWTPTGYDVTIPNT